MRKYIYIILTLALFSCSTNKNTFLSRSYQKMTTRYNVYFNGQESMKAGLEKIRENHVIDYSSQLPIFISEDESARSSAFSDMDRASVKALKAIKLHSITVKPKRRKKRSKKYIAFRKQKEYNDLIDNCYLLKAKADYYNKKYARAAKSLKYIIRTFPKEEIVYDARIWYVRCLTEQKIFSQVPEQLRTLDKKGLPDKYKIDVLLVKTFFYKHIKEDDLAIETLERLVTLLPNRKKAYYSYVLAQMYKKIGQDSKATALFAKVSKMKVTFDMAFNANINRAISFSGSGDTVFINELRILLKDKKNKDYRDQIYYALANVYQRTGDEKKALEYYWKSSSLSLNNDKQKSLTFNSLADYYYKKQIYKKAYICYDSCLFFNVNKAKEHGYITKRYSSLSSLVKNREIVSRQDSLVAIAEMSELDRNDFIDREITKQKELEELKKERELRDQNAKRSYSKFHASQLSSSSNVAGSWYFYNSSIVKAGKLEFVRKWGRRKLVDNWNRKNKAIVDDSEFEDDIQSSENNKNEDVSNKTREFYLKNIPLTKKARLQSDNMVLEALFTLGELYSDVLGDYASALKIYEDMLKRFPKNKYLLYIYYSSYNCADNLYDASKIQKYKDLICNEFPNSEYAKLVKNSSYLYEMQNNLSSIDDMYQKAYIAYDLSNYSEVIKICDFANKKYENSILREKFMLLKLYSLGKSSSSSRLKDEAEKILQEKISDDVRAIVVGILKQLSNGALPNSNIGTYSSVSSSTRKKYKEASTKYVYKSGARHYFILSFPRSARNLTKLNYRLNAICAKVLDKNVLRVNKEQLGMDKVMFVVSVLKDSDESLEVMNVMAKDKDLSLLLKDHDFRMFTISASNYTKMKYSESLEEYLDFFTDTYFTDKDDAYRKIGAVSRADMLFRLNKKANHRLVLHYLYGDFKVDIEDLVEEYDADYDVESGEYDSNYEEVVVQNIGAVNEAMKYFTGLKNFLKKSLGDDFTKIRMMVISSLNYRIMFEEKYVDEYLDFFKMYYKENLFKEDVQDENGFSYKEDVPYVFVLKISKKIKEKTVLSAFKAYNSNKLSVKILFFDTTSKVLLVETFMNKKQAMMYYRAALSNKKLYRALKGSKYTSFVISVDNYKKLSNKERVEVYNNLFKKWYLN